MHQPRLVLVLGGSGFIGTVTISAAVTAGHRVLALARSTASAETVTALGAEAVRGDTATPQEWLGHCSGVDAVVDLTQPTVPARLTARAMARMAAERVPATTAMLAALRTLPRDRRPLWVSVTGTDDLAPDDAGLLSDASGRREVLRGFARIGLPVRAVVAATDLDATSVHFGQMVYGPGKAFASIFVDGIRAGRAVIVGSGGNHLPVAHVDDDAAALVHVLGLPRVEVAGRTVVAAPASSPTQQELYAATAAALGRPVPRHVPVALAALVAGRANAEVMTLDARCAPTLLDATGFTFRHPTNVTGIPASLAALAAVA